MDTNNNDKSDNQDINKDDNKNSKVSVDKEKNADGKDVKENSIKEHLKLSRHDRGKIASAYALLTQIAIQVIVIMVGMFFLGKWIDHKLGTSPLFLLLMLLLGMASAFKSIYDIGMNQVKKYEKHDKVYNSYKKYNYKDEDEDENSDF